MKYHYIPIIMDKIKIPKADKDREKLDHSYTAGGNVK